MLLAIDFQFILKMSFQHIDSVQANKSETSMIVIGNILIAGEHQYGEHFFWHDICPI